MLRSLVGNYGMRSHTSPPHTLTLPVSFFSAVDVGVFRLNAGEVHCGPAPPVHLLSPGAVPLGACPVRGHEPSGCHDAGGPGEALGERGFEVVPRQARHAGGAGLVSRKGKRRFFVDVGGGFGCVCSWKGVDLLLFLASADQAKRLTLCQYESVI